MCLSSVVVGLGKQRRVGKINILIYYFVGVPLGCVLTFVADFKDGGFWIGLATAFTLVNILYIIVLNSTDFDQVSKQIAARYAIAAMTEEDDDPYEPLKGGRDSTVDDKPERYSLNSEKQRQIKRAMNYSNSPPDENKLTQV